MTTSTTSTTSMLNELARSLLDGKTFAVLTTLYPDGRPHATVVWVERDGDDVLFSTTATRRKTRNLRRDPRASITFFSPEDPYQYVGLEGTVSMTEEGGRALIDKLSMKYRGHLYPEEPAGTVRLVCRLTPTRLLGR